MNPIEQKVLHDVANHESVRNLPAATVVLICDLTLEIYKKHTKQISDMEDQQRAFTKGS